jgi:hypothetical protein
MTVERLRGSLIVVGSGIKAHHQITLESRNEIASAEKVFYAVCDPFTEEWLKALAAKRKISAHFTRKAKIGGKATGKWSRRFCGTFVLASGFVSYSMDIQEFSFTPLMRLLG